MYYVGPGRRVSVIDHRGRSGERSSLVRHSTIGNLGGPSLRSPLKLGDLGELQLDRSLTAKDVDQLKVKVLVNIFGRETPVELEFAQVAQL